MTPEPRSTIPTCSQDGCFKARGFNHPMCYECRQREDVQRYEDDQDVPH